VNASRTLPDVGADVPRTGGPFSRWLGRTGLRVMGWRVDGPLPDVPRCVVVVAPHTSNWDFVYGLATKLALGLKVDWLGKDSLFRFPFGGVLRRLGGIPVARHDPGDTVGQVAEMMRARRQVWLGLSPEGTRRKVERWKSGFHRIAIGAGVPIFPVALDYRGRATRLLPLYAPAADYATALAHLQGLFSREMALKPGQY
jgi:1-acyl-sn-glycerol-3-phosphate acyltransferase